MEKRGSIDFTTLLAIIVGAAILIFAIYGAVTYGKTSGYQSNSEAAKKLENLLNPLQAGIAECKSGEINFNGKVDIRNNCENFTNFGESRLSVKLGDDGDFYGVEAKSNSNYVFSKNYLNDTKKIYTYSCSFDLPYNVADYIVLIPDTIDYCFEDASADVKDLLEPFEEKIPVIHFEDCSGDNENFVQVGRGGMIQIVDLGEDTPLGYGVVKKGTEEVFFVKDTLIPAIFSDISVYDCVLDRLLYKDSVLASLYSEKASLMNSRGCSNGMASSLQSWKSQLSYSSLGNLFDVSNELDKLNNGASCRVW